MLVDGFLLVIVGDNVVVEDISVMIVFLVLLLIVAGVVVNEVLVLVDG